MTNEEAATEIHNWIEADGIGEISIVSLSLAISALREKQERENPNPLTLDELREMDGEPVYCTFFGTTVCGNTLGNGWYIVSKNYEKTCIGVWPQDDDGIGMTEDTYGTDWLAYRSEPKEA